MAILAMTYTGKMPVPRPRASCLRPTAFCLLPTVFRRQCLEGASELKHKGLGPFVPAFDASEPGHQILQIVIAVGSLGSVGVAGSAFAGLRRGEVHVMGGTELPRVLSI